jgi:hypothetical protein
VAGSLGFDEKRLMQRVYDALEESEVRQQNAFTFRLSSVVNDLQAGRPVRIGFDALPPTLMPQRPKNPNLFDVSLPVKK